MKSINGILGAAFAGLGAAAASAALAANDMGLALRARNTGFSRYPNGWRQYQRSHRILPHQGEREVARRQRQAERDAQRQAERDFFGVDRISRRGRVIA